MFTASKLQFEISDVNNSVKQALKEREHVMVVIGGVCFRYYVTEYQMEHHYNRERGEHVKLTIKGEELVK
ncbi:hypothetical protein BNCALIDO_00151 [Aeromonas phage vB_AdhM_TS9]|nr:hypothetical protein BNCALIDO_00151 [Aeromonas phage vB_AdhM_TS9]